MGDDALAQIGIDSTRDAFRWIRDNGGSNMCCAWSDREDSHCVCHNSALGVKQYSEHENVKQVFEKSRGQSKYFHQSYSGQALLEACQRSVGVPACKLTRDVATRWNSTLLACLSKWKNMAALHQFDTNHGDKATDGWKNNRYSAFEWKINNDTCGILAPVQSITVAMQAKNYPTVNTLLPGIDAVLLATHKDAPVRMPDGVILQPADLHVVTFAAREAMHADFVDRFVDNMPAEDLRFFSIATLLDPTMKNWGWPGCRRDKAFAVQVFLAEYDANWAPPPAPAAPAAGGAPAAAAAAPAFMQGLDFLLPAQAPPPWPPARKCPPPLSSRRPRNTWKKDSL